MYPGRRSQQTTALLPFSIVVIISLNWTQPLPKTHFRPKSFLTIFKPKIWPKQKSNFNKIFLTRCLIFSYYCYYQYYFYYYYYYYNCYYGSCCYWCFGKQPEIGLLKKSCELWESPRPKAGLAVVESLKQAFSNTFLVFWHINYKQTKTLAKKNILKTKTEKSWQILNRKQIFFLYINETLSLSHLLFI